MSSAVRGGKHGQGTHITKMGADSLPENTPKASKNVHPKCLPKSKSFVVCRNIIWLPKNNKPITKTAVKKSTCVWMIEQVMQNHCCWTANEIQLYFLVYLAETQKNYDFYAFFAADTRNQNHLTAIYNMHIC
jgi:hypothetical protein